MGWMQGLGEGVFRLLAARLMPASVRVVEQVTQLAHEERNEKACGQITRDAGLTSEVNADPGSLAERLDERLRQEDPNLAAIYVATLAGALGMVGRRDQALAVYETYLGIERADYLSGREDQKHLLRFLVPVCSPLQAVPGPERFSTWAKTAAAHLRELQSCLAKPAPAKPQPELDRITGEYIEKVSAIWKLDELAQALSPDVDLLTQLDDALHTVPVAYLPAAGRPLFQQARSVRSSLALLMTSLQLTAEQEETETFREGEFLLSVSHFAAEDVNRAEQGAIWLHHGFSVLAAHNQLDAYAAAETPACTMGLLRSALEELRHFRVLAICGHGDLFQSGIALPESIQEYSQERVRLWSGGGCDLSGVDWLWMVSCSIGRLGQNGDRDVEGFCVWLALHRARSVAAFRWPVHSLEAVSLVNESMRLYLEALRSGESADSRCLRARALNDARKSFFGDGTRPPLYSQVGLNTAAGCELFGLG